MAEDRQTISSSRVVAADVVRHSFLTVRRGFDPQQVRSYLEQVARELEAAEERESDLRRQVAEAEQRAEHPVIDEASLSAALGQQSAAVLRNAHDEAARVTQHAEESAVALVREAQQQATDIMVRAESAGAERVAEAELAAATLRQQVEARANEELARAEQLGAEQLGRAQSHATEEIAAARAGGQQLLADAREQGRAMIEAAQDARRRVLSDMAHRRRVMTIQIEQFRAARDELAAAVLGLRDKVDLIVGDLSHADDDARAAAAEVAERQVAEPDQDELVAEAEVLVAQLGVEQPAVWDPPDPAPRTATPTVPFDADDAEVAEPVRVEPVHTVFPETEAHDTAVVDEVPAAVPVPPEPEDGQTVEELFARLRASHADPLAADEPTPAGGTARVGSAKEKAAEPTADEPILEGDAATLAERSALLDPVITRLARKLKRVLQDDQNKLLDELRAGSGKWSDDLLAVEDEQRRLYALAASPHLVEAARAGTEFAGRHGAASGAAPEDKEIDALAEALAGNIVAPLRRRLEGTAGEDATERVGAAYREWRGERIERLVGDYALGAFCTGVQAASGDPLRWIVGGTGAGCADCEDNALAGALARGEEFPTGHHRPPAHAGCRCLVVPTPG